ncbi:MAG: response regulator [Cyanobacteriota bacterium]
MIKMPPSQPFFLIVEDHQEVAERNRDFLQQVDPNCRCAIANNPTQAMEFLSLESPDLIVVDLLYGTFSGEQSAEPGINLLRHIFERYTDLNVLVYSSEYRLLTPLISYIDSHKGGFAVANKLDRRSTYIKFAQSALNGELCLPRELRQSSNLNPQDLEVLNLLCNDCLSDDALANRLNVSRRAAQNYVKRLKQRLDVDLIYTEEANHRVAICKMARERGFLG